MVNRNMFTTKSQTKVMPLFKIIDNAEPILNRVIVKELGTSL